jgi:hypothetical protein
MKKTLRVSMLVILLACSVFAGEMPNGVVSTPPPPPAIVGEMPNGVASAGDMQNGVVSTSPPAESTATDVLLTLLQSILALF